MLVVRNGQAPRLAQAATAVACNAAVELLPALRSTVHDGSSPTHLQAAAPLLPLGGGDGGRLPPPAAAQQQAGGSSSTRRGSRLVAAAAAQLRAYANTGQRRRSLHVSVVRAAGSTSDSSSSEEDDEEEGRPLTYAEWRKDWQPQSAELVLQAGGVLARETSAILDYLQTRVGLSQAEAEHILDRITNCGLPEHQCHALRTPRAVSLARDVRPVVEYLAEELRGVDVPRCLSRHPHILVETPLERCRKNAAALQARLALSDAQLGRLATVCPYLLRADLSRNVLPLLDVFAGLGFAAPEARGRMLLKYPNTLLTGVQDVKERVAWLGSSVGGQLSPGDVSGILQRYVQIVCYPTTQYAAVMGWLAGMGLAPDQVRRFIARFPVVMSYSVAKRTMWVQFLEGELGLDRAGVTRVLVAQPDTLGRALPRLRHNVAVMTGQVGLSADQVRRLVLGNPGVLRLDLSAHTYAAKLQYLREELEVEDVPEMLAVHPFYVSYRLQRIAARSAYLRHVGRWDGWAAKSPTLWLSLTDAGFCANVARTSLAEYRAWHAGWQHSKEGQHWLAVAAERRKGMSAARLQHEAASDAAAAGADAHDTADAVRQQLRDTERTMARLQAAEALLAAAGESSSSGDATVPAAAQQALAAAGVEPQGAAAAAVAEVVRRLANARQVAYRLRTTLAALEEEAEAAAALA